LFLRDAGDTEIAGFGIAPANDLLFVEDVQVVKQTCTWVTAELDDLSIAQFLDRQVDEGRRPEQFFRLFLHTHPGDSPEPSGTDEETFARVFGRADWALMFILARGGRSYALLRYNIGPGLDAQLPVEVDYSGPFGSSDRDLWLEEYSDNIRIPPPDPRPETKTEKESRRSTIGNEEPFIDDWWRDAWGDYANFDRYQVEADYDCIGDI